MQWNNGFFLPGTRCSGGERKKEKEKERGVKWE
jgi:hypothetical protein